MIKATCVEMRKLPIKKNGSKNTNGIGVNQVNTPDKGMETNRDRNKIFRQKRRLIFFIQGDLKCIGDLSRCVFIKSIAHTDKISCAELPGR